MLQFTDPNIVRRQQIFNLGQTTLVGAITDILAEYKEIKALLADAGQRFGSQLLAGWSS